MAVEKTVQLNIDGSNAIAELKKIRKETQTTFDSIGKPLTLGVDGKKANSELKKVGSQAKKLKKEFDKNINIEQESAEVVENLDDINFELGEMDSNLKLIGEDSAGTFEDLSKGTKDLDKGLKGAGKGTKVAETGFKGIGTAWKAMGIGALIGIVMKLTEVFGKNQKIMDFMNIVSHAFAEIMLKLSNVVLDAGKSIIDFGKNLSSPMDIVKDFGNTIKTYVIDYVKGTIEGLGLLGSALVKVFKGDFAGAAETAKEGAKILYDINPIVQITKKVKEYGEAIIETTKAIIEEVKHTTEHATAMIKLGNEVKIAEAEQRKLQLTYQKDAELQRQIRDDVSQTMEARIEANAELGEILQQQFETEQDLVKKKILLAQEELHINKDNIELQQNLINAQTELVDLEERITGQRSEQLVNETSLKDERIANMKELSSIGKNEMEKQLNDIENNRLAQIQLAERTISDAEELARIKVAIENDSLLEIQRLRDEANDKEAEAAQIKKDKAFESTNQKIDQAQMIFGALNEIAQQELNAEKIALQEQLDAGLISQEQFDKESAKIEKEAVKRQKRNAILQILIDTAQGIAGAIKAGSGLVFPANLGAIISGVAAVLGGIAQAKGILNQVPGDTDSGGDTDVSIDTSGQLQGNLVPNMPEQSQTTLGGTDPIQAYVVESNITSSQALQEELEIQATL